ncbi:hypothetical protein ABGB12_06020 [Actinocorallia sp. B10E7]|uniref:hypothetical protein n=1 Tax=Actinocorallia sp. B10E7 TaxID=3153558 RepID=UPI00325D3EB4
MTGIRPERLRRFSRVGMIAGAVLLIVLQVPLAFLALVQAMPRGGPHELDAASEFRDLSYAGIFWGLLVLLLTFPFVRARFLRPWWYAVTLLAITVLTARQFLFPPYT